MSFDLQLRKFCREGGADLVGVTELALFKRVQCCIPPHLLDPYTNAVSMAMALEGPVLASIGERPSPQYADHYREVNRRLDALASSVAQWIEDVSGAVAEAVPASGILDEERLAGAISHKAVARMAGLGWQGKSLLLITPEYGPRVRLVTVLTSMALEPDKVTANRCGPCSKCSDACPVGAIKNVSTDDHYARREDAVDIALCNGRTLENQALEGVGARVCGICVKVCPWGTTAGITSKRRG